MKASSALRVANPALTGIPVNNNIVTSLVLPRYRACSNSELLSSPSLSTGTNTGKSYIKLLSRNHLADSANFTRCTGAGQEGLHT